jgi:hypothetical protein
MMTQIWRDENGHNKEKNSTHGEEEPFEEDFWFNDELPQQ